MFGTACPIGGFGHWATPGVSGWPGVGDGSARHRAAGAPQPWVRPVRADDLPALNRFYLGLSPASRRLRFHGAVNALPPSALRQLAAPDDAMHATLVAESTAGGHLIGEARYVRELGNASRAEFAMAVADDWQGRGLGRALLARLLDHAHRQGLDALHGSVLDGNQPMLWLVQSFGGRAVRAPGPGYAVEWRLPTSAAAATAGALSA